MLGQVYNSLDPIGQSSRSKVKIYKQAPIELKFTRNDHWGNPNLPYDFDLAVTFDLATMVKNVISL